MIRKNAVANTLGGLGMDVDDNDEAESATVSHDNHHQIAEKQSPPTVVQDQVAMHTRSAEKPPQPNHIRARNGNVYHIIFY